MPTSLFPRISLAHLPTPLEELKRLPEALGPGCPRLFIKRDDATGLATGGNKTRKLEFSLGAALAAGADHILTTGAPQSNHARQTAAACARLGLRCTLALGGEAPPRPGWNGNLFLDSLFGAEICWISGDREAELERLADISRAAGNQPFVIPAGASDAIGAMGYVAAVGELLGQLKERELTIDRIVCVSGSGGTHAGILTGLAAAGQDIPVDGIENGPAPPGAFSYNPFAGGSAGRAPGHRLALRRSADPSAIRAATTTMASSPPPNARRSSCSPATKASWRTRSIPAADWLV